jgi:hypothetical protein
MGRLALPADDKVLLKAGACSRLGGSERSVGGTEDGPGGEGIPGRSGAGKARGAFGLPGSGMVTVVR